MRWKYIVPRVVLLAAVWAFFTLAFDPLLKHEVIGAGESAVSAKVDVAGIKTGFFPPAVTVTGVRIANHARPGTNLLEFEALDMKLQGAALLKKSLVVDVGSIVGLRYGTSREDSGLLPEAPAKKPAATQKQASEETAKHPADPTKQVEAEMVEHGKELFSGLADQAKLEIDPEQFESVRAGDEIEKRWTATFNDFEARAQDLKKQVDSIQQNVKSNSGNKFERLEAYRTATGESTRLLKEIKQLKADIDSNSQQARTDFAAIQQAKEHDLTKIQDEAGLFQTDPQQLTEYLLGPELHDRLNEVVEWTKWARLHYQKATSDQKPVRMRGEDICFSRQPEFPGFLFKLLKISGEVELQSQPLDFTGTITGLTSDPIRLGQPVVMKAKGSGAADLDLKAVFDYTNPDSEPIHQVLLSYAGPCQAPTHLGDDNSLAVTVAAQKMACRADLKLVGESLSGTLEFRQEPVSLTAKLKSSNAQVDEHVGQALADIFSSIKVLSAELKVDGPLAAPHWSIRSDLGQQVAGGMKTALSHQLDQGRAALSAKLDQAVAQQSGRLQELFQQKVQGLTSQLTSNQQDVQQLVQQVTGGRLAELDKMTGNRLGSLKTPTGSAAPTNPDDLKKQADDIKGDLKRLFRK